MSQNKKLDSIIEKQAAPKPGLYNVEPDLNG